jgi:hypothetical protein
LSCLRNRFAADDLSEEVTDIIMSSWRTGTKKQYSTYIQKWLDFCRQRTIACHSPTMNQALSFLRMLFQQGLSYSTINTARSALSTIICLPDGQVFGSHHIVVRFMKGIFELRKPKPKYNSIWDVSVVLKYLGTFTPNEEQTLKNLTLKLVMLLQGRRNQGGQAPPSFAKCPFSGSKVPFSCVENVF